MQSALRSTARIESARLRENSLGIEIYNRIEHRVQALNLTDVRLSQFNRRHLAGTRELQLPSRRRQHQLTHERRPLRAR